MKRLGSPQVRRALIVVVICILVVILIRPAMTYLGLRYSYRGYGPIFVSRLDRFTGEVETYGDGKWTNLARRDPGTTFAEIMKAHEPKKGRMYPAGALIISAFTGALVMAVVFILLGRFRKSCTVSL